MDNIYLRINSMDYLTLVSMLSTQITPHIRKLILDKLTEMNNQLLNSYQQIPNKYNNIKNNDEIDLDDIINNIYPEKSDLDIKLNKIKKLQDKIIADRRRRKKDNK